MNGLLSILFTQKVLRTEQNIGERFPEIKFKQNP